MTRPLGPSVYNHFIILKKEEKSHVKNQGQNAGRGDEWR